MKPLTKAQDELLNVLQRGYSLRADRMDGRHKAQARIVVAETGEDVTSVAKALRDRGFLRDDWSLAKAGRRV